MSVRFCLSNDCFNVILSPLKLASWRYAPVTKFYVTCGHTIFMTWRYPLNNSSVIWQNNFQPLHFCIWFHSCFCFVLFKWLWRFTTNVTSFCLDGKTKCGTTVCLLIINQGPLVRPPPPVFQVRHHKFENTRSTRGMNFNRRRRGGSKSPGYCLFTCINKLLLNECVVDKL